MSLNNLLYFPLFDHCHGNHPPFLKISSRFEIRALILPGLQILNFLAITIEKINFRLVPHLNTKSKEVYCVRKSVAPPHPPSHCRTPTPSSHCRTPHPPYHCPCLYHKKYTVFFRYTKCDCRVPSYCKGRG